MSPGAAATLASLEQPYDFKDVISVAQLGPTTTDGRIVLATVRLVDTTTKAQFLTRYRVQVAKTGDRWLVKKIQT